MNSKPSFVSSVGPAAPLKHAITFTEYPSAMGFGKVRILYFKHTNQFRYKLFAQFFIPFPFGLSITKRCCLCQLLLHNIHGSTSNCYW